jgi:hypothetical protein
MILFGYLFISYLAIQQLIITVMPLFDFTMNSWLCFDFEIQLVEKQQDEGLDGDLDYVALENGFVCFSLSLSLSPSLLCTFTYTEACTRMTRSHHISITSAGIIMMCQWYISSTTVMKSELEVDDQMD